MSFSSVVFSKMSWGAAALALDAHLGTRSVPNSRLVAPVASAGGIGRGGSSLGLGAGSGKQLSDQKQGLEPFRAGPSLGEKGA